MSFSASSIAEKFVVAVGVNGSTDRTAEIARARGVWVAETAQRGYGYGCQGAIDLVTAGDAGRCAAYIFFAGTARAIRTMCARSWTPTSRDITFVLGARTAQLRNWRTMHVSACHREFRGGPLVRGPGGPVVQGPGAGPPDRSRALRNDRAARDDLWLDDRTADRGGQTGRADLRSRGERTSAAGRQTESFRGNLAANVRDRLPHPGGGLAGASRGSAPVETSSRAAAEGARRSTPARNVTPAIWSAGRLLFALFASFRLLVFFPAAAFAAPRRD